MTVEGSSRGRKAPRRKRPMIFKAMAEADHVITRLRWGHPLQRVCEDFMDKRRSNKTCGNAGTAGGQAPDTLNLTLITPVVKMGGGLTDTGLTIKEALEKAGIGSNSSSRSGARPVAGGPAMTGGGMTMMGSPPLTYRTGLLSDTSVDGHHRGGRTGRGRELHNGPRNVAAELDKRLKLVEAQSGVDTAEEQRLLQAVASLSALCSGTEAVVPGGGDGAQSSVPRPPSRGGLQTEGTGLLNNHTLRLRERASRAAAVEYMEGTCLYYGSSVALQSCHGGFLCLDSSRQANARPTSCRQPNVMMKVWNLEDLTYTGAIRYGDKVWLQLGRHEILGTSPNDPPPIIGEPALPGQGHEHGQDPSDLFFGKPTSINCRKANLKAARLRGCWVFLKKSDPLSWMGEEVQHLDEIVLEQEFAYLCSHDPESAELRQVPSFPAFSFDGGGGKLARQLDELMDCNNNHDGSTACANNKTLNVYGFTRSFGWRIHLTGLPPDAVFEEERQRLAHEARVQLRRSASQRKARMETMEWLRDCRASMVERGEEQVSAIQQERKDRVDLLLRDKYMDMAAGFNRLGKPGSDWLASLYGPGSLWAAELKEEEEARRRKQMRRTLRSAYEKDTPREGERLDFRPRGGQLVTGLEEKRTLAQAAQIECRVPISVWSAIMAKKDKERVKLLLRQTASVRTIQRAIRKFREKKWERKLLQVDPSIFKAVAEERNRQARAEGRRLGVGQGGESGVSHHPKAQTQAIGSTTIARGGRGPHHHQAGPGVHHPPSAVARPKSATAAMRRTVVVPRTPVLHTGSALLRPASASAGGRTGRIGSATATPTTSRSPARSPQPPSPVTTASPAPTSPTGGRWGVVRRDVSTSPKARQVHMAMTVVRALQPRLSHGTSQDEEEVAVVPSAAILEQLSGIDADLHNLLQNPLARTVRVSAAAKRMLAGHHRAQQRRWWEARRKEVQDQRIQKLQQQLPDEQPAQAAPPGPEPQEPAAGGMVGHRQRNSAVHAAAIAKSLIGALGNANL